MVTSGTTFRCEECGATAPQWTGRCGGCGSWGAVTEVTSAAAPPRRAAAPARGSEPLPLWGPPPPAGTARPWATGVAELDSTLAGGLPPGSVTLVGGEPGAGKSTLLLQVLAGLARAGHPGLLVSAEESVSQVRARAARLDADAAGVTVLSETSLPACLAVVDDLGPEVVVVDSIQTVADPGTAGAPGSTTQVRACAARLAERARAEGLAVVLVGHVTKGGDLAGPRALEHLVDTVVSLEGDRHHALRMVRVLKHRFGPTHGLGLLEMTTGGLVGVADPGRLFLADRRPEAPGSVVTPVMEGARPIVVEVQALVGVEEPPSPRRSAQGVDGGRLAMLLAVLGRRAGLSFGRRDVYVSVVGGLRVAEPGVDLAVALSLAGAALDRAVPDGLVVLGEVGLGGEVRQVANSTRRLSEARDVGYSRAIVPSGTPDVAGVAAARVRDLDEAIRAAGLR